MGIKKLRAAALATVLTAGLLAPQGWITGFSAMADSNDTKEIPAFAATPPIVYKPPALGAPGGRIGGGTRSIGFIRPHIKAIAPPGAALTAMKAPVFMWYASKASKTPVQFSIMDEEKNRTVFETRVTRPVSKGLQALSLADYDVHLQKDVIYTWTVAWAKKGAPPSGGRLVVKNAPPAARSGSTVNRAAVFANHGYWYDAVWELWSAHEKQPRDPLFRGMLADLLNQGDLKDPAQWLLDIRP